MTTDLNGEYTPFVTRLETLRFRIERIIISRWYDDFDAFELGNLIQAGIVHLWRAYCKKPDTYTAAGDGYWFATAKRGAYHEIIREYRQRYRQQGSGKSSTRKNIEVVVSAGDLLATHALNEVCDDLDETALSTETVYGNETEEIQDADRRIDIPCLEETIYAGTNPQDHPMIAKILRYMREGLTIQQMAKRAGVKVATIRCTIRRMQQACGAAQEAKHNRKRPGDSLDGEIRTYREQGLGGPEIARLIGTDHKFVYRRLHAMQLM
jgi:DNA-directed RNA polymerase specialized sigma24 family protein